MEMLSIAIIIRSLIKTCTITYSKYTVFEISLAFKDQSNVHLISLNLFFFFLTISTYYQGSNMQKLNSRVYPK